MCAPSAWSDRGQYRGTTAGAQGLKVLRHRKVIAMFFWYDHDVSGWGWFGMSLGMVLFWALIITVFVLLFRSLSRGTSEDGGTTTPPSSSRTPEQLLADRFARGEIDEEEYRRRLQVLREGGPTLTKH